MAINKPITAQEAQWIARQRTFVNGLMEQVIYPKIEERASYGEYEVEIFLHHFDKCSSETKIHVIGILERHGYKAKVINNILKIEWK